MATTTKTRVYASATLVHWQSLYSKNELCLDDIATAVQDLACDLVMLLPFDDRAHALDAITMHVRAETNVERGRDEEEPNPFEVD
jgi:hypothetical protein